MIITIAGKNGSGKSTVAEFLAKKLKLKHYSIGDLRGEIAMKMGITIDELNKIGEKEDWTDKIADEFQKELGKKQDNFVIDGRLSYHFIPNSIKIYLKVTDQVAADRIFNNQRPDEPKKNSVSDVKKMLVERYKNDRKRYKHYYRIDIEDLKNYDIVIDTSNLSKEQMENLVLDAVNKFKVG